MAKKTSEHEINLLPQEEFEASTLGRVLKWLLSTFRYIVIGTEMIVMLAFLSRFWLDARSGDLSDAITQKQAIVSSYSTFEKQFRDVQSKLSIYKNFSANSALANLVLSEIAAKIPTDVTLSSTTINGSKLTLVGLTSNENSASSFVTNLTASKFLTNVNLISVTSSTSATGQLTFTISANLKGGQ